MKKKNIRSQIITENIFLEVQCKGKERKRLKVITILNRKSKIIEVSSQNYTQLKQSNSCKSSSRFAHENKND